jgi:hypothetical protein
VTDEDAAAPLGATGTFPVSACVQALADVMLARGRDAENLGEPRLKPIDIAIESRVVELGRVEPDPAKMLRVKATTEPRPVERPDAIVDQLRTITPQFFLRNTHRAESQADPDWLDFERRVTRAEDWRDDLEAARRCQGAPRAEAPDLASPLLAMLVAERRVVMVETRWHTLYGRPDPVDDPA